MRNGIYLKELILLQIGREKENYIISNSIYLTLFCSIDCNKEIVHLQESECITFRNSSNMGISKLISVAMQTS